MELKNRDLMTFVFGFFLCLVIGVGSAIALPLSVAFEETTFGTLTVDGYYDSETGVLTLSGTNMAEQTDYFNGIEGLSIDSTYVDPDVLMSIVLYRDGNVVSADGWTTLAPGEIGTPYTPEPGFILRPLWGGDSFEWNIGMDTDVFNIYLASNQTGSLGIEYRTLDFETTEGEILWQAAGTAPVPEPSTIVLMGLGLVGLSCMGRKKIRG